MVVCTDTTRLLQATSALPRGAAGRYNRHCPPPPPAPDIRLPSTFFAALVLLPVTSLARAESTMLADIKTTVASSAPLAERRAAWERLARSGPEVILPLLRAMPRDDTSGAS